MLDQSPNDGAARRRGQAVLVVVIGLLVLGAVLLALAFLPVGSATGAGTSLGARLNERVARMLASSLVAPPRPGEAIVPQIRFEQPWPQWLALAVLGGSIALVVFLYRREGSAPAWYRGLLAGLRIALVVLAMFMLSEAVLSVERTGLPTFVLMVDDSASASIADPYADPKAAASARALAGTKGEALPSRLALAEGWIRRDEARLLRELQKQHQLRLYLVSNTPRMLAEIEKPEQVAPALGQLEKTEPSGTESRLGDAVREVLTELRGAPPTAIVLLSDGQTTAGEPLARAAEFAKAKGVPLFPVGLGDPAPTRDIELSDLLVDDVVFVDDQVRFQARISGHGFAGEKIDVKLRRRPAGATDPKAGEDLERVTVTAPADGKFERIEIPHRPTKTGSFVYELVVDPRPRELQTANNQVARTVNVREDKLQVLLVEGEPRYEFRYLISLLKRDKTITVRTVLQSADPEYAEQEDTALPTFPTAKDGPDGLFSYDAILFGDVDLSLMAAAQIQNLVDFVEQKGGGLMFIAGQNFDPMSYKGTPLEALVPIRLSEARDPFAAGGPVASYRPALSVEGRTHPIFRFADDEAATAQVWDGLPSLDWFLEAPRKQELAFVLATHPTIAGSDGPVPLLLYQYVGAGKVLFQGYDETWKWRFRVGDRFFGRYWIQAIRFLARSKLLGKQAELVTDRRRYQRQQPIRVQVRFPNPALAPPAGKLAVQVSRKGQPPRRLELDRSPSAANLFEGVLPQASEGEYEVRLLPPPVLEGGMPTASFVVEAPAGEFERIPMAEAELIRVAETSQGRFFTPATSIDEVLKRLPAPQTVPLDTDPPVSLWNTPLVLGLFLAILAAEWILRKRKQMV